MDIDLEAMDELNEKMVYLVDNMESLIFDMQKSDSYIEASNELFRIFHTIKALSSYLKIAPLQSAASSIEEILSIIRFKRPPILPEILDWMLMLSDHIVEWGEKIEVNNFDLDPIDKYTLNMVKTAVITSKKASEILKESEVVVVTQNSTLIKRVQKKLVDTAIVNRVHFLDSADSFYKLIEGGTIGIAVLDLLIDDEQKSKIASKIIEFYPHLPVVLLLSKKLEEQEKIVLKGLNIQKVAPISTPLEGLVKDLENIALKYCQNKKIKLLLAPTIKRIESLQPPPKALIEIRDFQKKENTTLRELSAIISQDPLISAKILKIINSASYGLKSEVSSIHQAVTLLGKESVIGLALKSHLQKDVEFDLSPYGIDIDTFFKVSRSRMSLALKWYSKISLEHIGIITTSALLGNIGQILVSEAIIKDNKKSEFLHMVQETNPTAAEIEFLYTTTEDTTADLLEFWGLDKTMIDAIRYTYDLANSPDEIKSLSIILYVIFSTFPIDGEVADESTIQSLAEFLDELNFNSAHYLNAIKKVVL